MKKVWTPVASVDNFAYVDIFVNPEHNNTYAKTTYRKGACDFGKAAKVIGPEADLETEQLRAIYAALNSLTRNARVQIHGVTNDIVKKMFLARKPNTKAWNYMDGVMKVGLNGHTFDIISVNGKVNPHIEKAETYAWFVANKEVHEFAVRNSSAKSTAAPTAKVETPAPTAKAETALEAKIHSAMKAMTKKGAAA